MNAADIVRNEYFDWMTNLVCGDRYSDQISYRKLLMCLHSIEFTYFVHNDANRAGDGMDLRYRFAYRHPNIENAESYLGGPCSVLEMLVALANRCEESIMEDPLKGDRTGQWFWGMITNLGLGSMTDGNFDKKLVYDNVQRFLDRKYEPNGKGGLFTIRDCERDLRTVEIWYQLCWFLNSIV